MKLVGPIRTALRRSQSTVTGLSSRRYSTETPKSGTVLRGHIADHLYKQEQSFFARSAPVSSSKPLDFASFLGEHDYRKAIFGEYEASQGFLTPVELFKPHYSEALANFIVQSVQKNSYEGAIHLCEIGAGNGTNMKLVLDYLQRDHRAIYARTHAKIIDVSKPFIEIQKKTLQDHLQKLEIVNESIFDWKRRPDPSYGFIMGLEILDNLPHDKVILTAGNKIYMTLVHKSAEGKFSEIHLPVDDAIIRRHLQYVASSRGIKGNFLFHEKDFDKAAAGEMMYSLLFPVAGTSLSATLDKIAASLKWSLSFTSLASFSKAVYIPTGAQLLFEKVKECFPHHGIIFADFDSLPGAMRGVNAPIVQQTHGNTTIDLSSYLTAELGAFDILFPTNFDYLQILHHAIVSADPSAPLTSQQMKTKVFMKQFANTAATKTRSGYNPLLADFINTAFFIAPPKAPL